MRWWFERPVGGWEIARWWLYAVMVGTLAWVHFSDGVSPRGEPWAGWLMRWRAAQREEIMYRYLAADDAAMAQRAAAALWEHWLSERGPAARERLERGLWAMREGNWAEAEEELQGLMGEHPDWAEPVNAMAMLRYRQRRFPESEVLCRRVLELKPRHFGAWAGLAHCAMQQRDWATARWACRQALRIQPHEAEHRRVLNLIERHIPALDV